MCIKKIIIFVLVSCAVIPFRLIAGTPGDFNYSSTINTSLDLGSLPERVIIWDGEKMYDDNVSFPNGGPSWYLFLTCLSNNDDSFGACPVNKVHWGLKGGTGVRLKFIEQRTHISKTLTVNGWLNSLCGPTDNLANITSACPGFVQPKAYIYKNDLRNLIGGVWKATLKLQVGEWHDSDLMHAYWEANITLHVTDDKNIRIWLPQFYGSTANVVMPVMPAYWALNKPGLVSAEKVVETCLYDGYNSNSQRFEVTLNSNYTDSTTQDFLLQNTSEPTSKPLHYQVIASPPGQSGAMQRLNPGITQMYTGINSTGIRQVIMPGLQTPVACVPWPIRIKLLPFDLSRQAAGHYSGTFSITFTPSLD